MLNTFCLIFFSTETVLEESEVGVSTQLTTWGELTPAVSQEDSSHSLSTSQGRPSSPVDTSASETSGILLEGWQKYWEHPPPSTQANGISPPNIKWLKCDEMYGLFERPSKYKNAKGEIVERRLLKEKMEFHPPPIPTSVKGGLSNMMAFFTTPVFFWRPVGVMQAKIRCPSCWYLHPSSAPGSPSFCPCAEACTHDHGDGEDACVQSLNPQCDWRNPLH